MLQLANWIEFPELGIHLDVDREITFGSFSIKWYGVLIALGMILAVIYALYRCKKDYKINTDHFLDVIIGAVIFGIIGARLYYVIFSWDQYKDNPISILYIWEGGLAIYGGIIGGIIAAILICRWRKIKIGSALDLGGLGLLIGQCLGRWGNFFNQEAFGGNTDMPWGMTGNLIQMGVNGSGYDPSLPVHPCFLYESLWCAIGFILLHFLSKKRKFDGQVFIWYMAWYGLGRFIIEGFRTDSLYIPGTGIRVSQLLAALIVIAAVIVNFYIMARIKKKRLDEAEYTPVFAEKETEAEMESIKNDIEEDENKNQEADIVENQEDDTILKDTEINNDENSENEEVKEDKENPDSENIILIW